MALGNTVVCENIFLQTYFIIGIRFEQVADIGKWNLAYHDWYGAYRLPIIVSKVKLLATQAEFVLFWGAKR